ncbi:YGGT family-domain-containing protein [Ochromonadaceae sp. CCMP2298]|nr:YGGT family-domain-containing protein [Ochromonadaceae sp. CCMP2298]
MQGFTMSMLALLLCALVSASAFHSPARSLILKNRDVGTIRRSGDIGRCKVTAIAATLPGDPLITGTIAQGIMNGLSLYGNVIFARICLSWFPNLYQQFPILQPLITVTDPYLNVFRRTIPKIGGFDISVLPAVFILDILSSTTAAIGAEFP